MMMAAAVAVAAATVMGWDGEMVMVWWCDGDGEMVMVRWWLWDGDGEMVMVMVRWWWWDSDGEMVIVRWWWWDGDGDGEMVMVRWRWWWWDGDGEMVMVRWWWWWQIIPNGKWNTPRKNHIYNIWVIAQITSLVIRRAWSAISWFPCSSGDSTPGPDTKVITQGRP